MGLLISRSQRSSGNAEDFVRLQTEPPSWMRTAVLHRQFGVSILVGTVHRLQEEVTKIQMNELLRIGPQLRKDKLQFITKEQNQFGADLRTAANPIDAAWWQPSPVGFYRHLKSLGVESLNEGFVQLLQRLAAGTDDKRWSAVARCVARPFGMDRLSKRLRRIKLSSTRTISADEVRVAEAADRTGTILFASRP